MSDTTSSADLTLMLTSDGKEWCKYIIGKLEKFSKVTHSCIVLDEQEYENPPEITAACRDCVVLVLLATPGLLQYLADKAGWFSQAVGQAPLRQGTSALVVLLLVEPGEVEAATRDPRYDTRDWRLQDAGRSAREVQERLAEVLDVLERCKAARGGAGAEVTASLNTGLSGSARTGSSCQDVDLESSGMKVQAEAPPQGPSLKHMGSKGINTSDNDDGNGDEEDPKTTGRQQDTSGSAIKALSPGSSTGEEVCRKGGRTPPVAPRRGVAKVVASLYPSEVFECGTKVAVVFGEEIEGEVQIKMEHASHRLVLRRLNTSTFEFAVPEGLPPDLYKLDVYRNGQKVGCGRLQLVVRCPDETFFTSPHYLRQSLRLRDLQELDLRLKEVFSGSLPDSGLDTLFAALPDPDSLEPATRAESEYPTLLHYAAAQGLSELCAALLDCPCSPRAFSLRNRDGLDPAEMAAHNGFGEIGNYISEYMAMQAASTIYEDYLAMHSRDLPDLDEKDYECVDIIPQAGFRLRVDSAPCLSDTGLPSPLIPPALPPRPADRVFRPASEGEDSPGAGRANWGPIPPPGGSQGFGGMDQHKAFTLPTRLERGQVKAFTLPAGLDAKAFMGMTSVPGLVARPSLPRAACGSRGQSELIELNEMVKNKEINLNEASMLYQSWKDRHAKNFSLSFKERQMELSKMKDEYLKARAQQTQPGTGSKLNFLQRFGFGWQRSKNQQTIKINISDPVAQRPAKGGMKVFSRSTTQAGASSLSADRDSTASSSSSGTCSSRDSGWSQCSRSSMQSAVSEEEEVPEESDSVFQQPEAVLRRPLSSSRCSAISRSDLSNRASLGMQFLQQLKENETRGNEGLGTDPPPLVPPRIRPNPRNQ